MVLVLSPRTQETYGRHGKIDDSLNLKSKQRVQIHGNDACNTAPPLSINTNMYGKVRAHGMCIVGPVGRGVAAAPLHRHVMFKDWK